MMKKPIIVVLAGGTNSRFMPLNTGTHKGFIQLLGKPIFFRALESLVEKDFLEIVIVVSSRDYRNSGFEFLFNKYKEENPTSSLNKLNVSFVLQPEAKGMADALLATEKFVDQDFILASPYYLNLGEIAEKLWNQKNKSKAKCVFSATATNNPNLYGMLELNSTDQKQVLGVIEKPDPKESPSNLKIDSIYLFNKQFLKTIKNTPLSEYSLEEAIGIHASSNYCTYVENTAKIQSLKYAWHLFDVFNNLITSKITQIHPSVEISSNVVLDDRKGAIIIEEGARIGDFVKIVGPCYIGRNGVVGDYSFIRHSSLEENSVCGAKTEIARSLIFPNASIHYSYLADSIVGEKAKIGAGLITANKRFDRKNIRIEIKNKLIDTGRNVLGVIIGEKSALGIGIRTMPGTVIMPDSTVPASSLVSRIYTN